MIIDSHCHLDFPEFQADLSGVVERARTAGVERLVTISTKVAQIAVYRDLAERFDDVFFTVGTHPLQAAEEPDVRVETLVDLAAHPKCVAIGEAGLDYHYDRVPRDIAETVFRTHIEASRQTGLPLVIHARNADADMARILKDEMGQGRFEAVLHCFTSSRALAEIGIELGLFVSFSGVVTFKGSDDLRALARDLPLERILVETDAPFLAPVPMRGKGNEPSFVVHTARAVADARNMDFATFAEATRSNTYRLFSKMPARDPVEAR